MFRIDNHYKYRGSQTSVLSSQSPKPLVRVSQADSYQRTSCLSISKLSLKSVSTTTFIENKPSIMFNNHAIPESYPLQKKVKKSNLDSLSNASVMSDKKNGQRSFFLTRLFNYFCNNSEKNSNDSKPSENLLKDVRQMLSKVPSSFEEIRNKRQKQRKYDLDKIKESPKGNSQRKHYETEKIEQFPSSANNNNNNNYICHHCLHVNRSGKKLAMLQTSHKSKVPVRVTKRSSYDFRNSKEMPSKKKEYEINLNKKNSRIIVCPRRSVVMNRDKDPECSSHRYSKKFTQTQVQNTDICTSTTSTLKQAVKSNLKITRKENITKNDKQTSLLSRFLQKFKPKSKPKQRLSSASTKYKPDFEYKQKKNEEESKTKDQSCLLQNRRNCKTYTLVSRSQTKFKASPKRECISGRVPQTTALKKRISKSTFVKNLKESSDSFSKRKSPLNIYLSSSTRNSLTRSTVSPKHSNVGPLCQKHPRFKSTRLKAETCSDDSLSYDIGLIKTLNSESVLSLNEIQKRFGKKSTCSSLKKTLYH